MIYRETDMFFPAPLAAAYHVYQLVTLRNM